MKGQFTLLVNPFIVYETEVRIVSVVRVVSVQVSGTSCFAPPPPPPPVHLVLREIRLKCTVCLYVVPILFILKVLTISKQ